MPEADAGITYELAPEYLEHARREAIDEHDQTELSWGGSAEKNLW